MNANKMNYHFKKIIVRKVYRVIFIILLVESLFHLLKGLKFILSLITKLSLFNSFN